MSKDTDEFAAFFREDNPWAWVFVIGVVMFFMLLFNLSNRIARSLEKLDLTEIPRRVCNMINRCSKGQGVSNFPKRA